MKPTLTNREIFDRVKTHLLAQNQRALTPDGACAYRTVKEGVVLKCAVGCLIPDTEYQYDLEGRLCSHVDVSSVLDFELTDITQHILLNRLQVLHDKLPVENWPQALDDLEKTLDPDPT